MWKQLSPSKATPGPTSRQLSWVPCTVPRQARLQGHCENWYEFKPKLHSHQYLLVLS